MKSLVALFLLVSCNQAFAAKIPFSESLEQALNVNGAQLDSGQSGRGLERVARVIYDFATDAGTSGTTLTLAKSAVLPAKAIVTRVDGYINTAFTSATNNRVRILCGSVEIDPQRDLRGLAAGATFTANPANVDCGSSPVVVTALNTDGATTAGKVIYQLKYYTKD